MLVVVVVVVVVRVVIVFVPIANLIGRVAELVVVFWLCEVYDLMVDVGVG